jgi:hypothetical protein
MFQVIWAKRSGFIKIKSILAPKARVVLRLKISGMIIRFFAKNVASDQGAKIKDNFDKSAFPHDFNINDLVWFEDFAPLGKNPKLTPKWQGPAKITEINGTNARLQLPNGKSKIYNVMHLKKFFAPNTKQSESETDTQQSDLDFKIEPKITGPVTRAMKKLLQQKEATEMAISVLCDLSKKHCSMCEWEQEFSDNPLLFDPVFAKRYCRTNNWLINKQSMCARCKLQFGEHLIKQNAQNAANSINSANDLLQNLISKQFFDEATSKDLLQVQKLIKDSREASANLINAQPNIENLINEQSDEIFLINESLRKPLLNVANKLLGRQCLSFEQLTPSEKDLWTKFETVDIYQFLTGDSNTVPEFCHNWLTFSAKPKVNIDIDKIAQRLTPIPFHQLPPAVQRTLSAPSPTTHNLRERKGRMDYKVLHLGQQIKSDIQQAAQGVKQKCKQMKKSVTKSAKATVTKLALGAFSPKQQPPASAPASPRPSSSSFWTFWPSK